MATLPDVSAIRPVARPTRALSQISPASAGTVGASLQGIGASVNQLGAQILDREATAAAKEADAAAADKIRALLYDPETGFANLQGGAAVNARERVAAQIDAIAAASMEGLGKEAQRKLKDSMDARKERAFMTIDAHTSDQRRVWVSDGRKARIESSYQDVLANPAASETELLRIEGELRGQAVEEGWSPEKTALEIGKAKSTVYRGVAEKIASVDPMGAAAYLQENRDKMLPSDVVDLETKLIPLAKQAEGRRVGASAALSGVSTEYLSSIRNAESGGNDGAKNPTSTATGRYQFIASTWAEVMKKHPELGLTVDGRLDPAQQELAIRAFTADNAKTLSANGIETTRGNLYAAHFLGAGGATAVLGASDDALVSDLVGPGVVSANGFLSGMTVGDFKAWASRKAGAGAGYSETAAGIGALLDIQDPTVRAAAFDEYQMRMAVKDGEAKAATASAAQAGFDAIVSGGSVMDMTPEQQSAIGREGMAGLLSYERAMKAGTPIETDFQTYANLRQMAIADPAGFKAAANSGFAAYADKLSNDDRKALINNATAPDAKVADLAASSLMSVATAQLRAIGIKANDPKEAAVQTSLLKWQDGFKASQGRTPTQLEIDQQVGRVLAEVVIDPAGWNINNTKGRVYDAAGQTVQSITEADSLTIGGKLIPPGTAAELAGLMEARGMDVTPESLMEQLALFAESKL